MKNVLQTAIFLLIGISFLFSETKKFEDVKIRRHKSADKRELVDKLGVLAFDDDAQQLTFEDRAGDDFSVPYSDITKAIFDSDAHMNASVKTLAAIEPIAVALVRRMHVHDRWLYLEYGQGADPKKVLLVVPEEIAEKVTAKTQSVLGERVTIASYAEKGEKVADSEGDIDKRRVPDLKSKHSMVLDKKNHPLPEVRADKATIVVVCPPLAARYTGKGNQFKLHANGKVIAVNKMGTYSIAYVDPGKYSLISQSENANGFDMQFDGGKTYYFIQEIFQGALKGQTMLSRNSPEVVMYLVDGAYFSDWKRLK
jgi:hypothetical protein